MEISLEVVFALRRVILLRSDIYFVSDIALRAVLKKGEYNITKAEGFNITFALRKYHSAECGISLKQN